ncbi:MAG: 50S ribosomal protein L10 [Candidatus Hydrogenedentales bacterium]
MPKQEKIDAVAELKARIEANQVVVMTKYIGIKAGQVSTLRKKLRDSNVQMKVYKNTLAARVLDELNLSAATKYMDGPTAWTFSNDPAAPPKVLKEFNKEVPLVSMVGGILDGKVLNAAQLEALANLPSRDVLLGQVVGTIAAPLRNFVGVLSALPRNLVNVLDQVKRQKEGAAA